MSISDRLAIMVVGDSGVGKTSFIKKVCYPASDIREKYVPTSETQMYKYFDKQVTHVIIDTSGHEKFSPIQFAGKVDAVIVMYTAGNKISYNNTTQWIENVKEQYGDVYIVLCATKISNVNCYYPTAHTKKDSPFNLDVFHIDAASGFNVTGPINNIFKHFSTPKDDVESPTLEPKLDFTIDPTEFQKGYTETPTIKSIKEYQDELRVIVADINKKIAIENTGRMQYNSKLVDIQEKIGSLNDGILAYIFDNYSELEEFDDTLRESMVEKCSNIAQNMGYILGIFYNHNKLIHSE
jgi:KaiC/GvpD/RAD55 family RecA-like ATPase